MEIDTLINFGMLIITGTSCFFSFKSAKAAKDQADTAIKQLLAMNRPTLTAYFNVSKSGAWSIVIKNEGASLATNVNVSINKEFSDIIGDPMPKLGKMKLSLASQQEFKIFMCGGGDDKKIEKFNKVVGIIDMEYYDSQDNKYNNRVEINTRDYYGFWLEQSYEAKLLSTLSNIHHQLKQITKTIKKNEQLLCLRKSKMPSFTAVNPPRATKIK